MDATERRKRASFEAADWFARLQAGDMERLERQQFVGWLRESHIHVTEMLRIAQIHGALEQFGNWAQVSTGAKTNDDSVAKLPPATQDVDALEATVSGREERTRKGGTLRGHRLTFFALAATAIFTIAIAWVLPRIRGQIIETERGERREVVLNDGSVLRVDPETRLRVKYTDEVRRVFLERGRALFRVAKNPHRPFVVRADNLIVRAVGTAFGVEAQKLGVIVTVAEGKVAVSSGVSQSFAPAAGGESPKSPPSATLQRPQGEERAESASGKAEDSVKKRTRLGKAEAASPSPTAGGSGSNASEGASELADNAEAGSGVLFLTADEQVRVPSRGVPDPVRGVDSRRALAWAEGRLIFQNDTLGKAVAEFNRYNHVQLAVADPALANKPVSGVFNASDPEAFVAFLQSVTTVEVVRDGDRGITIGRGPRP